MTDTFPDSGEQLIGVLEARAERRNERREFFRTALGAGAVAAAGAAAVAIGSSAMAQETETSDTDILNFALNLEYLEAQFYSYAVFGTGLAANLLTPGSGNTTTQGTLSPGRQVNFTDPVVARYAREIASDEIAHVTYLRATLDTIAIAMPSIDLSVSSTSAFTLAGRAAGIATNPTTGAIDNVNGIFDPYASDENFLLAAFLFEDVGVTAYKGSASLLTSKVYLQAAAQILAAEAYHASIIRTVLYNKGVSTGGTAIPAAYGGGTYPAATPTASYVSNTNAISNARDLLDGTVEDDQGISPLTLTSTQTSTTPAGAYVPNDSPNAPGLAGLTASNIVPTGPDGIVYGRATTNVLNILYLNSLAVSKGGFFPNGLNGADATSAAN